MKKVLVGLLFAVVSVFFTGISSAATEPHGPMLPAPAGSYYLPDGYYLRDSNSNHICEIKLDGKVVESIMTTDRRSCEIWTNAKAKEKGWVRQTSNHICEFKQNGKVVEMIMTTNRRSCKAWTDAKVKEKV